MRIGWATPFNVRSAIGKFSQIVCEELSARGNDVEIIRLESGEELDLQPLDSNLFVIDADQCDAADYDRLIVNLGNHAPYHAQIVALMAQRAPLGIFHDMEMRDFEWGMAHRHSLRLPRLLGLEEELADKTWSDMVHVDARPILATLAAMTSGAVIHGPHYLETVSAYCPGPVEVIPLCFPDDGTEREGVARKSGRRVTIFGTINENKQAARVLEALAVLRPRLGHVELHLAGAVEDRIRSALSAQAKRLGLRAPIFHGYVSDDALQDIIESSNALCCLRYPVTEGGSASLATALFRARPLIISDTASYSMVPDEFAYKVSYGEDPLDLAEALMRIFSEPDEAEAMAARACDWAKDQFSASTYVDRIEPILHDIGSIEVTSKAARDLVPAVISPNREPMIVAVEAFAGVLDWMQASQDD